MPKRLRVKYPLFLSGFNENLIFSTDFGKNIIYQVSSKSVWWEPSIKTLKPVFPLCDRDGGSVCHFNVSFSVALVCWCGGKYCNVMTENKRHSLLSTRNTKVRSTL